MGIDIARVAIDELEIRTCGGKRELGRLYAAAQARSPSSKYLRSTLMCVLRPDIRKIPSSLGAHTSTASGI